MIKLRTLGKNVRRHHFEIIFLFFLKKIGLTFHANCLIKSQILFSRKYKKNINLSSAEFAQKVAKVKETNDNRHNLEVLFPVIQKIFNKTPVLYTVANKLSVSHSFLGFFCLFIFIHHHSIVAGLLILWFHVGCPCAHPSCMSGHSSVFWFLGVSLSKCTCM